MQQNLFLKKLDSLPRVGVASTMVMALERQEDERLLLRFLRNDPISSVSQVQLEEDMASQLLQMLADELHVLVT